MDTNGRYLLFCITTIFYSVICISCSKNLPSDLISYKYNITIVSDGDVEFYKVRNPNDGTILTYSTKSAINLIEEEDNGYIYAFKDMNGNGVLDPWEDWRNKTEHRTSTFVDILSIDNMLDLTIFRYGNIFTNDNILEEDVNIIKKSTVRTLLNPSPYNIDKSIKLNNILQEYAEIAISQKLPYIPVSIVAYPSNSLHLTNNLPDHIWPYNLGIAATFNPQIAKKYGQILSEEFRSLGISTVLGPQVNVLTDPRFTFASETFGEDSVLVAEMAVAMTNGIQSTYDSDIDLGWGYNSVNVMLRNFPGIIGEGGRHPIKYYGKYMVYTADSLSKHLYPFKQLISLNGATKSVAGIMTSYQVSLYKNGRSLMGGEVATAYNSDIVNILRKELAFTGAISTEYDVTRYDPNNDMTGSAWGLESVPPSLRYKAVLYNQHDLIFGNIDMKQFERAKKEIIKEKKSYLEKELKESAKKIVTLMFNTNLFDNPYVDYDKSSITLFHHDIYNESYETQLTSVVMLKNNNVIERKDYERYYKDKVVYVPSTILKYSNLIGKKDLDYSGHSIDINIAKELFKDVVTDKAIIDKKNIIIDYVTPDLSGVDIAIVGIRTPQNGNILFYPGYDKVTGTYYPISLQYEDYYANNQYVRLKSISGDRLTDHDKENRSYFGEKSRIANSYDLLMLQRVNKEIQEHFTKTGKKIPLILIIKADSLFIPKEVEPYSDAILLGFGVSDRAMCQVALGGYEPKGLLPITLPKDMHSVEKQKEDIPFDTPAYVDSNGMEYRFGYGLDYQGVIKDERTKKYVRN